MAASDKSTPDAPAAPQVEQVEQVDWLLQAGFVYDADKHQAGIQTAAEAEMHRGGDYDLQGIYVRGAVTVTVEQNTDTRHESGMKTMTQYPAVAIIEGPKGRCSAPMAEPKLVLQVADDLA